MLFFSLGTFKQTSIGIFPGYSSLAMSEVEDVGCRMDTVRVLGYTEVKNMTCLDSIP